jgi:hypothetical protein
MRRVVGETLEEMSSAARRWSEVVSINWPRRTRDAYRSKSIPTLYVEHEHESEILEALDSVEVPETYISVLTMMIREQFFNEKCGGPTPESAKFFEQEIRGKTILLLRAGDWIDEPSSLSLKNLNSRLEKLDLGRRSDLNFSSNPVPIDRVQKYDPDFKKVGKKGSRYSTESGIENDTPDFETLYRDGSTEQRTEILESRPWMRFMLIEKYGEP